MLIKFKKFPDGQPHLDIDCEYFEEDLHVHMRIRNFEDIGKLWLLNQLAKQNFKKINHLTIYWLASARWDRPLNIMRESFDLRAFSDAINYLNIPEVDIVDPHSYATLSAIKNSRELVLRNFFYDSFPENKEKLLVIPDGGAQKRGEYFLQWQNQSDHVQCLKTRHDDKVSVHCFAPNYEIQKLVEGRDLIIVDDICDGGATFIAIAEQLKQYRPKSLSLMITHGIFSKGFDVLKNHFQNIYTTNTFQDIKHIENLYNKITSVRVKLINCKVHIYEAFEPNTRLSFEHFIID